MPSKLFPIRLEVEEIALGTVLRKLNDMPGIAGLHLDLGLGGQGAGRRELEEASRPRENVSQLIVKALMEGAKSSKELFALVGGKKSSVYTATSKLKKEGAVRSVDGKYHLTAKANGQLKEVLPALPAPKKIKKGPKGRATQGAGAIVLKSLLQNGPKTPIEIRTQAPEYGVSAKSITGVLSRGKRDGLIKKNGSGGYELTAKGLKIEATPEVANG